MFNILPLDQMGLRRIHPLEKQLNWQHCCELCIFKVRTKCPPQCESWYNGFCARGHMTRLLKHTHTHPCTVRNLLR